MVNHSRYQDAAQEVLEEVCRAKEKFPADFNSAHEGFAVLLEEVDEMWDEVKRNNTPRSIEEAIQVGAMAVRYIAEFSNK